MRQKIGIILLVLALCGFGWVMWDRHRRQNPGPTLYQATLYSLHVRAVDATSGEPLGFVFEWPKNEISPFFKGSGPTIVETREDGSKSLDVVGIYWPEGVDVTIRAPRYRDEVIRVKGERGGITHRSSDKKLTVKMERAPETDAR